MFHLKGGEYKREYRNVVIRRYNVDIQTNSKIQMTMNNSQKFGNVFGQDYIQSQSTTDCYNQVNPKEMYCKIC